jgi:hypothetical protein
MNPRRYTLPCRLIVLRRPAADTGLGIAVGGVDALECRFPQENGTLHAFQIPYDNS